MMLSGMRLNDFTRNGTRAAIEFPDITKGNAAAALRSCLGRKDLGTPNKDIGIEEQQQSGSREAEGDHNYIMADNNLEIVNSLERFDNFEGMFKPRLETWFSV